MFWVGVCKDIKEYCHVCKICAISNGMIIRLFMGSIKSKSLEIFAIDFTTVDKSKNGLENILVMTDIFNKYSVAIPTRNQQATTVSRVLRQHWFQYGIPSIYVHHIE